VAEIQTHCLHCFNQKRKGESKSSNCSYDQWAKQFFK
jgi:hypothetical protein